MLVISSVFLTPNALRLSTTFPAIPWLVMVFDGLNTGMGASGHSLSQLPYTNISVQLSPITNIFKIHCVYVRIPVKVLFSYIIHILLLL